MAQNIGTLISAAIRPNDSLDPIASAYATEIKGGLHTSSTSTDRNNIIFERREWGMMCYVVADNKTYQLTYGYIDNDIMNNSNWKEFSGSSGSGSGGSEWIDSVISIENSEPLTPLNGDRYLLNSSPIGASWSSLSPDLVVEWDGITSHWSVTTPKDGMSVRVDSEDDAIYKYEGVFGSGGYWMKERLSQLVSLTATTLDGKVFTSTSTPSFNTYYTDMLFLTKFSTTNVGTTASLNINGVGEVEIKKSTKTGLKSLSINELRTDITYSLNYDGSYLQLFTPSNDDVFNVKHYIEPSDYIIVPQYYQYWVYADLEIAGTLINYGHVVICNGSLVISGGSFSNYGSLALVSLGLGTSSTAVSFSDTSTIQFTQSNTIFGLSASAEVRDGSLTASKLDTGMNGGATAGYVLSVDSSGDFNWIDSTSFAGTIGPAEDGDYTDGIFTDFNPSTPIGTAVDRFNEMLLLLAPTPPSNWNNAIASISFTDTSYSPRSLTSGSVVSNMFISTTPTLTDSDSVGTQDNAKVDTSGLSFSLIDQGVTIETVILSGTATTIKNTGNIRHSASGDPYIGVSGKSGFWTGITDFSLSGTLPAIAPSSTQRTLTLNHPGSDSPETFNYYIDSPLTVTIGSITASVPSMTSYISGVPTLTTSDTVTAIGFSVSNVSSYFYSATSVYQINAGLISGSTGDPDSIPTSYGETGNVTGKSGTIQSSQFSDLSFSFTARGRNSIGTYGSNTSFTSNSHRVDTVSNESSRKTSGSGSYPASGYNGSYDSTQSLLSSYTEELQLRNGLYVYPSVNYTSVGGPDYSTATGTRWATFNIGTFTNNSAFTLNINSSTGIGTSTGVSGLLVEVKIEGSSYWVDGDSAYSGVGSPGSSSNGVASVVTGSSTATSRRITFGSVTHTGSIIVRIGITGSGAGIQFASITATSIV